MFDIHMLTAQHGDCLWIEYGNEAAPHRILIDCGTGGSYEALKAFIERLPDDKRYFELFVVTHVDDDHIGGALKLLENSAALGVTFGDIWFNALPHMEGKTILSTPELLGARQGEELSRLIVEAGYPWNRYFKGKAIVCNENEPLPKIELVGGMTITLLSPYWEQLQKMRSVWNEECRKAHLLPGGYVEMAVVDDTLGENVDTLAGLPFIPDAAPANGSSIAFIAEYRGAQVLFGADAYAPVLVKSIRSMGYSEDKPLNLAALKAPHHGSSHNVNRDLMKITQSDRVLISTNGNRFKHPDMTAIARIVKFNKLDATLCFNYATEFNSFWAQTSLQEKYRYKALYPEKNDWGLRVQTL